MNDHEDFLRRKIRAEQYCNIVIRVNKIEFWFLWTLIFDEFWCFYSTRAEIFTKKISFNVISASKSPFRNYRHKILDVSVTKITCHRLLLIGLAGGGFFHAHALSLFGQFQVCWKAYFKWSFWRFFRFPEGCVFRNIKFYLFIYR